MRNYSFYIKFKTISTVSGLHSKISAFLRFSSPTYWILILFSVSNTSNTSATSSLNKSQTRLLGLISLPLTSLSKHNSPHFEIK